MILVFGSINIDVLMPVPRLPAPGETVLGGDYALAPGGKGANQALAARRAGAAVAMAGAVGADGFAAAALELLERGEWKGVGVLGPEAFPAAPYLAMMRELGSPTGILELPVTLT